MYTLSKHASRNRATPTIILPHEENHGVTSRCLGSHEQSVTCRPNSTLELPELCARSQVGAGVLGLPSAMAYLGWPGGIIVLVLSCECLCLTVLHLHCNSQALCLPFLGIAALISSCEQPCLTIHSFIHSVHAFQSTDQVRGSRHSMAALQPALSWDFLHLPD